MEGVVRTFPFWTPPQCHLRAHGSLVGGSAMEENTWTWTTSRTLLPTNSVSLSLLIWKMETEIKFLPAWLLELNKVISIKRQHRVGAQQTLISLPYCAHKCQQ